MENINEMKRKLATEFKMQDLNEMNLFLDTKIERDIENGVMKIGQQHNVNAII